MTVVRKCSVLIVGVFLSPPIVFLTTMIKFVGTAQNGKESLLYFFLTKGKYHFFRLVRSHDGFEFEDKADFVSARDDKRREDPTYDWKSFRIAQQDNQYFLTYKLNTKSSNQLFGAVSQDLLRWEKTGKIADVQETGAVVPNYKYREHSVMYFGEKEIKIAYSAFLHHWKTQEEPVLRPRQTGFDAADIEVGNAFVRDDHILLTYYVKKAVQGKVLYSVGAAIFAKDDPTKLLWRSEEPLWEHPEEFHHEHLQPLGSVIVEDELILYWLIGTSTILAVPCPIPDQHTGLKNKVFHSIIKKADHNPILAPNPQNAWESRATFNSAAVYENGKVHFLYRALGDTDLSVLGYATSSDGVHIDERSAMPAYIPREPFETPGNHAFATLADHFVSGGGYGGVEDPRITKVEDRFYLTYVAFDGANPPRAAMSSIHKDDFNNQNWGMWAKPKLISAPGMVNKSAVVFPRKVNGKYVVLHRVYPNILVDYLDDLEFNDYLQGHHFIPPRKKFWDSKKVGAGAPPMETKDGWLLIYQSVGYQDPSRYKIGAMMLDKNNPSKVLYRTHTPIIEPVEPYENNGFKAGVVYPCGSVIMKDKLHIYYGGADSYLNVASTDLDRFLYEMKRNREPKLRYVQSPLFN